MTRDELLSLHEELCAKSRELMKAKNHDYAKDSDPFRNFRKFGALGILVRLGDKLSRLESFIENGEFAVKDEALDDTVQDIINYAVIFKGWNVSEKSHSATSNGVCVSSR